MREITLKLSKSSGKPTITSDISSGDKVNMCLYYKNNISIIIDGYISSHTLINDNFTNSKEKITKFADNLLSIIKNKLFLQLNDIEGHYNIIICDKETSTVTVITDRFGMRPLYWHATPKETVISTSVKAIKQTKFFNKDINYDAIKDFIKFEWVTNDATFFKNINRFHSGSVYIFSENKQTNHIYWNWPKKVDRNRLTVEENADHCFKQLQKAVGETCTGLKMPAVTISGGLDSRIIAGILNNENNICLYHCPNNNYENLGARGVAKALNIKLRESPPLRLCKDFQMDTLMLGDGCTSINQFWLQNLFEKIKNEKITDCVFDGFFLDMLLNPPDFMSYHYGIKDYITGDKDKITIIDKIYGLPAEYLEKYFFDSQLTDINKVSLNNVAHYCSDIETEDAVYFSQILYLMTRGKRYSHMMGNINQHFCSIRFPGLDYNLINSCLNLPVEQFKTPYVYLRIFEKYFPELNNVIWAKTGLPLSRGIQPLKKSGKYLSELNLIIRRLTLGLVDFISPRTDNNYLFRRNRQFHFLIIKIKIQ